MVHGNSEKINWMLYKSAFGALLRTAATKVFPKKLRLALACAVCFWITALQ